MFLPYKFLAVLAFYYLVTVAYSFSLKQVVLVDVFLLAGLYTLRMIAGAAAAEVDLSFWLLSFSMFIFLSLAMVKRFTELKDAQKDGKSSLSGRGYSPEDMGVIAQLGSAAGYCGVLVMALYINSAEITQLYTEPRVLWFICPIIMFMISRFWLLAGRGQLHDDPVVFAIKDKMSCAMAGICAFLIWFGI